MKKIGLHLLLFSLFVALSCGNSEQSKNAGNPPSPDAKPQQTQPKDGDYKRYQIESGIIEFSITGAQQGTEIIYFDRWGRREAKFTSSELTYMGNTQKSNTLTLTDSDWIYLIDLDKKEGSKSDNALVKDIVENQNNDPAEMGEKIMKTLGGVKIGTEEVLGKRCDVWEVKTFSAKSWIWSSITLKTESNLGGINRTVVATKIQENVSIPEEKFALPPGLKIIKDEDPNN